MSELLRPLPLSELRARAEGRHWQVHQHIAALDSLTPVSGELRAVHHGAALEVSASAETIVTLCCDRCLQHFNHPLRAELTELVELRGGDASGDSLELLLAPGGEDLDDRLDPAGSFDPEQWLFEQLSLRLPLVNRCGDDCPGPAQWSSDPQGGDPRWAALAGLNLRLRDPAPARAGASGPQASAPPDPGSPATDPPAPTREPRSAIPSPAVGAARSARTVPIPPRPAPGSPGSPPASGSAAPLDGAHPSQPRGTDTP